MKYIISLQVTPSLIPVHVVVYDCKAQESVEQYEKLARASGGRLVYDTVEPQYSDPLYSNHSVR